MIAVRLLSSGVPVNWAELLETTGADPGSVSRLVLRDRIVRILIDDLPCPGASILKQCMLSSGADALVHREVITCGVSSSKAVVYGTPAAVARGCDSLRDQPFGLSAVAEDIRALLAPALLPESIEISGNSLEYSSVPLVMGILNVTPDSFSDGGSWSTMEKAAARGAQMAEQGAAVVDIGGESTRPGSLPVPAGEQIRRVVPVITGLRKLSPVPLSIDTRLPRVAAAAVEAGAGMINSVDALETPGMLETAAELNVPVCLMHMKGNPESMQNSPSYGDVSREVAEYLKKRVQKAEKAGIPRSMILIDPGIGFGKKLEHNIELLRSLEFLKRETGCRLLLGHSRKSFLGMMTGVQDPRDRDSLTHLLSVTLYGADMVRVHDTLGAVNAFRAAEMTGVRP